jgi:uncharacterized protein
MKDAILDKREEAALLFDCYKGLLSPSQQAIFSDYYDYDLSLSEIAENRKISRAAVSDALHKGFTKLEAIEKEVAFAKKKGDLQSLSLKIDEARDAEEKEKAVQALKEYIHHGL